MTPLTIVFSLVFYPALALPAVVQAARLATLPSTSERMTWSRIVCALLFMRFVVEPLGALFPVISFLLAVAVAVAALHPHVGPLAAYHATQLSRTAICAASNAVARLCSGSDGDGAQPGAGVCSSLADIVGALAGERPPTSLAAAYLLALLAAGHSAVTWADRMLGGGLIVPLPVPVVPRRAQMAPPSK